MGPQTAGRQFRTLVSDSSLAQAIWGWTDPKPANVPRTIRWATSSGCSVWP
jgi:hypothetical protein